MALIMTFLGKGGVGCTTIAVAAAKQLASQGRRVLLASQAPGPALGLMLNASLGPDPQSLAPNLQGVQFHATALLEKSWEALKQRETQYLRTPFFKDVFGQELSILPGMDSVLALNSLREWDASGQYDVIVYDGTADQATLRLFGMPEVLSWYTRRFRKVFADSDLGRILAPFIQPVASAILNVNLTDDAWSKPSAEVDGFLEKGRQTIANPKRTIAYLVTSADPGAIATAKFLWGGAQQVGLTVGGVLCNQGTLDPDTQASFAPLPYTAIPTVPMADWQPLINALPDLCTVAPVPPAIAINEADRQVCLFLPGFDKKQVKLTQSGPEITIEAGDQRRNVFLPDSLRGRPVTGAKFQDSFLIISF
jgi:anion-transporting  ArsA/GET3 family ATPase